jgi:hypothetical protein
MQYLPGKLIFFCKVLKAISSVVLVRKAAYDIAIRMLFQVLGCEECK